MTHTPSVCPVHLFEGAPCSLECMAARVAFKRLSERLRTYWYHRRQGVKPMPQAEYRKRFAQ